MVSRPDTLRHRIRRYIGRVTIRYSSISRTVTVPLLQTGVHSLVSKTDNFYIVCRYGELRKRFLWADTIVGDLQQTHRRA